MANRPLHATAFQIKSFLTEIEDRLLDCSPETLTKVASALCFALYRMDEADALNAEFITIGEKENV